MTNIPYTQMPGGVGPAIRTTTPDPGRFTTDVDHLKKDGFDLLWSQKRLADNMQSIEEEIRAIEANGNLSDTERMFAMQTAMNSWSAVSNLRTNMLKSVSDTLKTIVRNVA